MRNDIEATIRRLVDLLTDWADWQKGYSGIRGYASSTPGTHNGRVSQSFDDMYDRMNVERCRMIDAAVDDLPPAQAAAICKRYGVSAVFRFPRDNYERCLLEAHQSLLVILSKRGVVV